MKFRYLVVGFLLSVLSAFSHVASAHTMGFPHSHGLDIFQLAGNLNVLHFSIFTLFGASLVSLLVYRKLCKLK